MAPAQGWHAKIENGIELRPAVQPLPGANPGGSLWHHKSKSHLQFWQVFWHTSRKRVQIHLHPSVWCLIIPTCQVSHNRILRFLVHNSRCFTFTYVPIQLSFSIFPAMLDWYKITKRPGWCDKNVGNSTKHRMIVNLVFDYLIYSSNLCSKEPDKLWG